MFYVIHINNIRLLDIQIFNPKTLIYSQIQKQNLIMVDSLDNFDPS